MLFRQEEADEVIDIFSQSEPSQLVSVCASPPMVNISPERTLQILRRLEDTAGVSVPLTITMATMMLLMDDVPQYTQLMERHAEVREGCVRVCDICTLSAHRSFFLFTYQYEVKVECTV